LGEKPLALIDNKLKQRSGLLFNGLSGKKASIWLSAVFQIYINHCRNANFSGGCILRIKLLKSEGDTTGGENVF
jgi:hypothetical protein